MFRLQSDVVLQHAVPGHGAYSLTLHPYVGADDPRTPAALARAQGALPSRPCRPLTKQEMADFETLSTGMYNFPDGAPPGCEPMSLRPLFAASTSVDDWSASLPFCSPDVSRTRDPLWTKSLCADLDRTVGDTPVTRQPRNGPDA